MSDPLRKAEKARQRAAHEAAYAEEVAGLPAFKEWPKISRLNREIVITEKIDGTNAAIGIFEQEVSRGAPDDAPGMVMLETQWRVYAQSRTRIITVSDDNMGFARWVHDNAQVLIDTLGPGLHFGEWWGRGIQRGYGLDEKRFSLFNVGQWGSAEGAAALAQARADGCAIYSVPLLYTGPWTGILGYVEGDRAEDGAITPRAVLDEATGDAGLSWLAQENLSGGPLATGPNPRPRFAPNFILEWLQGVGSFAAPGFMRPEGIVIFHKASGTLLKATVEKDEEWKGKRG